MAGFEGFVRGSYASTDGWLTRAQMRPFYSTSFSGTSTNLPPHWARPALHTLRDILTAIEGQVKAGKVVGEVVVHPRVGQYMVQGKLTEKDSWPNGVKVYAFPTRWGEMELLLDSRINDEEFWTGPRGTWDGNNQHRVEGQGRGGAFQEGTQSPSPA